MAYKVPTRCNPTPISQIVVTDEEDGILVDDATTALLVDISRSGSGFTFEYERQITPEES